MSDAAPSAPQLVTELKVSAHLMQLDAGVYCVYHTPGSAPPDPVTGLPGARLSLPPGRAGQHVTITGFRDDGWLGSLDAAALIRVGEGPAQVLMTIYQARDSAHEAPRLQVTRLVEGAPSPAIHQAAPSPAVAVEEVDGPTSADIAAAEISAHMQQRGDVLGQLDEWVGEPGSQHWVEGFAISPKRADLAAEEIEYQAVLGRGWLSPWAEGGQFCGSRGMALPILGLRVRLRGKSAETHTLQVSATFTDGTAIGPVGPGDACEAESLAPLEAFRIMVVPAGSELPDAGSTAAKRLAAAPKARAARVKDQDVPASEDQPASAKPPRGRRG